jgi:hypothetical protein
LTLPVPIRQGSHWTHAAAEQFSLGLLFLLDSGAQGGALRFDCSPLLELFADGLEFAQTLQGCLGHAALYDRITPQGFAQVLAGATRCGLAPGKTLAVLRSGLLLPSTGFGGR